MCGVFDSNVNTTRVAIYWVLPTLSEKSHKVPRALSVGSHHHDTGSVFREMKRLRHPSDLAPLKRAPLIKSKSPGIAQRGRRHFISLNIPLVKCEQIAR